MPTSAARALLLLLVAAAIAGVVRFLLPPRESPPADDVGSGVATLGESPVALAGAPPPRDDAPLGTLLGRLQLYGSTDGPTRQEIVRRATEGADIVDRLIALLALDETDLQKQGLFRYQVFQALLAIGRPAALPLGRHLCDLVEAGRADPSEVVDTRPREILYLLQQMGAEAAPVAPLLLETWAELTEARDVALTILGNVGPEAAAAVPLLVEIVRPPVDDALVGPAGAALLQVTGGSEEALAAIREALLDEETLGRPWLLRAVADHPAGAAPLVPNLVDLLQDPERPTQQCAAYALGRIGVATRPVLLGLVHLLQDGTTEGQRLAAGALSALGEEGTNVLVEVAHEAEDVDDRLAAFWGLVRTGADASDHLDVLLGVLDEDVERGWKNRALSLISAMAPLPAPDALLPHLERALADDSLARGALDVLARLPGDAARSLIVDHLRASGDPDAALIVIDTLARHRVAEPAATEMLIDLLQSQTNRAGVSRILLNLANARPRADAKRVLPLIEPLLGHEAWKVRAAACAALGALEGEDERIVALLVGILETGEYFQCGQAGQALARYPAHAARIVPALINCIAKLADEVGSHGVYLSRTLALLAPRWSGTSKAFDRAVARAGERGKKQLTALRERIGR